MNLLICGSRTWRDEARIHSILDERTQLVVPDLVINGGAHGADRIAAAWAKKRGIPVRYFKPDWDRLGGYAGLERNNRMLVEGKPDLVIAFRMPGDSRGTDHMVRIAEKAGVPVEVVRGVHTTREGKCPECLCWFPVEWSPATPPGGWWWKDSAACPGCGYCALVESECEFRWVEVVRE